ncbi:DUF1214 domain-containing protein [Vibrio sp. SCSIO 43136]|uniref:DUF1214 domain-containing protein n=1 Tax=Vibrio sp. SCSIO 43136 TaxID=2819101 RepID=UPI002074E317|nr:DUF1214 domain-containing protein [Vibrio sp. SCSIO 43136]USD67246.1 DUF1214 domain-containing protein [Vibrio sp. SCSIO 43136]
MKKSTIATVIAAVSFGSVAAEPITDINDFFAADGVVVERSEFPMFETAKQMLNRQSAVGVNNFVHNRTLTPTDDQPVVRMNRDVYYSLGVANVGKGATLTMPELPEGKYLSFQVVPEDHRTQEMVYGGGTFELTTHTGDYVYIIVRMDATLSEEEAKMYQDQMIINSNDDTPFSWDTAVNKESFDAMEASLKRDGGKFIQEFGAAEFFGAGFNNPEDASAEKFIEEAWLTASAIGWGGAQSVDNFYEVGGNMPADGCYKLTFEDPENKAFWSVTAYNANGFMFSDTANINSLSAPANEDGSYSVHFGCEGETNNLPIENATGQWNAAFRHYQPTEKVTEEGYRVLPLIEKVK